MDHLSLISAVLGGMILALGLASARLATSPFPPTLLALLLGVVLGPKGFALIDLSKLGDERLIVEKAARLTLGIALIGVALRVPRKFPRLRWRELTLLLSLGMPATWAISTALLFFILDLPFWMAALIGAIVTATDPIASGPIVTGSLAEKILPNRLRNTISFESGANDGLSFLFVFLAFLMLSRPAGEALRHWLVHTVLYDVVFATVLGLFIGYAGGRLLQMAERRETIASEWRLVYTVALGLFAVGAGRLIGSDELLVVFAAGAVFAQVASASDRKNEEHGQEAVNRFFSIPIFTILGIAIPWDGWRALGWNGVAAAVLILLLRRPPVLLLLQRFLPAIKGTADALFTGWFGPIAVAAIYYATLIAHKLGDPKPWHVVSLIACVSVVAHGLTAAPLTRLYGRRRRTGLRRKRPDTRLH